MISEPLSGQASRVPAQARMLFLMAPAMLALSGPPDPLDAPVSLLVRQEGLTSAARLLLPLQLVDPDDSSRTLALRDVVACGAASDNVLRLRVLGRTGVHSGAEVSPLQAFSCDVPLRTLADANCSSPYFVVDATLEPVADQLRLRLGDAVSFRRAGGRCRPAGTMRLERFTHDWNKNSFIAALGAPVQLSADVAFQGQEAIIRLRSPDDGAADRQSLVTELGALRGAHSDPLANVVTAVPISVAQDALEVSAAAHPLVLRPRTGIPGFPTEIKIDSPRIDPTGAGHLRISGLISTDNAGRYDLSIDLRGDDLKIHSITTRYRGERCTTITNLARRVECEARNALRNGAAQQLSQALTPVYRNIPLRPVSTLLGLNVSVDGRAMGGTAIVRRVAKTQDHLVFQGYVAPETRP